MTEPYNDDKAVFEDVVRSMEAEIVNAGAHLVIDAEARRAYSRQIQALSEELSHKASTGRLSWKQAASEAQEIRNTVMELMRSRSTPVGSAIAQKMKSEGRTLNELVARKTGQLFGPAAHFDRLSNSQKNRVYAEVVKSAGKSNPKVNAVMAKASYAGRGLIVVSLALSIYTVATADDKLQAAGREVAVSAASIGGGFAMGAAAGLACGPGAPVCVAVGAFVGGALAAFAMTSFW